MDAMQLIYLQMIQAIQQPSVLLEITKVIAGSTLWVGALTFVVWYKNRKAKV